MAILLRVGIIFAMGTAAAWAQGPAFEVASVKLSGAQSVRGSDGGPGSKDPGRYSFHSATLLDLIAIAYEVEYFQISSKTALDKQRYDLTARISEGATKAEFREMMQALLAERFHLKMRMESRDFKGMELVVAKLGAKLNHPAEGGGFPVLPPGKPGMSSNHSMVGGVILVRMRAQQQPMSALARSVGAPDEVPVVDHTGLTGKYDFTLEYAREIPGVAATDTAPAGMPPITVALQQQLGLQLIDRKVPLKVIVVESVDTVPTEN